MVSLLRILGVLEKVYVSIGEKEELYACFMEIRAVLLQDRQVCDDGMST
jgi:hypothetical protein